MSPHPRLLIKIAAALICAVLALCIPLFWTTTDQAVILVKDFTYWMLGATSLLFLYFLRDSLKGVTGHQLLQKTKKHLPALVLILLATLYLHLHMERGFKILFDEHAINSTAMNMHFENRAFVTAASHVINSEVVSSIGHVDKRPAFFPFVVSLIHSLTGFRPENAFWLNSALTGLLLGLIYTIAARTCGKPHGLLAVLLITGLPLLAQNTNGGGYEILNLCLICGVIIAGLNYMSKDGSQGLNLLLLTSILLANTRYESIVYVAVPALLFLLKSYREKQLSLTWFSVFSPLLLITPLLSYAVFQGDDRFIQTESANFFSVSHLPSNVAHAITYLFEPSGDYSNSVLLSFVGIIAGLFLTIQLIRHAALFIKKDNGLIVQLVVFLLVAFNTTLALSCYWGAWTDPATSRFSLPLQLFFALSVPLLLHYDFKLKRVPKWLLATGIIFIIGISSPHAERLNKEPRMIQSKAFDWVLNWAQENASDKTSLFVSEASIGLVLYEQPAIPFKVANFMPERVLWTKGASIYDKIYATEILYTNGKGGYATPKTNQKLNTRFIKETVAEHHIKINLIVRISEITGLLPSSMENETHPADLPPPTPAKQASLMEWENYFLHALPLIPENFKGGN